MNVFRILRSGEFYKLRKYSILKDFASDYKKDWANPLRTFAVHRKGFTVSDWEILGLDNANCRAYLNSKDYFQAHPINGSYSKMIDDKMIIKYILSGTELSGNMPDYYYLIDENGRLCALMDAPGKPDNLAPEDVFNLLKEKQKLAIKLVAGSIGKGFYKAEYKDGKVFVNDAETAQEDFFGLISRCKNYIISEYLTVHPYLAEFWPGSTNTIRFLVGRVNREWRMIKSFIRFGSKTTGVVENFNRGGALCYINEDGFFHGGYQIAHKGKRASVIRVTEHEDTHKVLDGQIPCWEELKKVAEGIERLLPQTRYLGFDFVITDRNEVKLLEINSLTSLDAMQLDGSILNTENGGWFFSSLR